MKLSTTAPTSQLPGVYVQLLSPPKSVGLIPSDIVAVVGEFSRGPVDTPLYVESLQDVRWTFGGITPNPNGLANTPLSGWMAMLQLAQQGVRRKLGVRVANALMATASLTLKTGSNANFTLHAGTPGTWVNNNVAVKVEAGGVANTRTYTIYNPATGEREVIPNVQYADIAAAVRTINANSRLVVATSPIINPPIAAPTVSASGSDGTLDPGVYKVVVTYVGALGGQTTISPEATVTVAATNHISISVPTLTGAASAAAWITPVNGASGTETFAALIPTLGTPLLITAPWTVTTTAPPLASNAYLAATATAPDTGTFTFPATGTAATSSAVAGSDGANASSARHLGAEGSPSTGVYSLVGLVPHPNFVLVAGTPGTDTSIWTALAAAAMDNDWQVVASVPTGTASDAAVTLMQGSPVAALAASAQGDFIKVSYPGAYYVEQELYNTNLLVPSQSLFAGVSARQASNTSAGNKPLVGVIKPEYSLGNTQRENLIAVNLNTLAPNVQRNANGSSTWGFTSDNCLSGRAAFEIRMQSLILENFSSIAAPYLLTPNTPDTRSQVSSLLLAWLGKQARLGLIPENPTLVTADATTSASPTTTTAGQTASVAGTTTAGLLDTRVNYAVKCDDDNNIINGVTSTDLIVDVQTALFPNINRIVFRAAIGATVQVSITSSGSPASSGGPSGTSAV